MASQLSRVSVSLVVALVLTFAVSGIALAAQWGTGCSGGNKVCLWVDGGFSGPYGYWLGSNSNYAGQTFPGSHAVNNHASSLRNNYGTDVLFYDGANYTVGDVGIILCVDSGEQSGDLWWGFHNDKLSSHKVLGHDNQC